MNIRARFGSRAVVSAVPESVHDPPESLMNSLSAFLTRQNNDHLPIYIRQVWFWRCHKSRYSLILSDVMRFSSFWTVICSFNCVMEWGTVQQWEDELNFDDRFMVQQKELPTGYFGLDCHGDEPTLRWVYTFSSSFNPCLQLLLPWRTSMGEQTWPQVRPQRRHRPSLRILKRYRLRTGNCLSTQNEHSRGAETLQRRWNNDLHGVKSQKAKC